MTRTSPLQVFQSYAARRLRRCVVSFLPLLASLASAGLAAESAPKTFDVPRGPAAETLRLFSQQSSQQVVYMLDSVRGEITNAVKGSFVPRAALDRMLAGTRLVVVEDGGNALAVQRLPSPPQEKRAAVETSGSAARAPEQARSRDEAVVLTPFEVSSRKDRGYRKTNSVTTSRIGVAIEDVPQAIQVISSEILADFSLNRADDVFQYSSSVIAHKNEMRQANQFQMRGFAMPRYLNGMQWAGSGGTYAYLSNDNIDRVEIAKGAVGLFFGNSSPNGVANYITKRPEFIERTDASVAGGSYGYAKTLVDTQGVLGRSRSLAYRVITSWGTQDARINDQRSETFFVAPSLTFQPSSRFKAEVELNHTKFNQPYLTATSSWTAAVNPQYWADITNPSPAILNYFKTTYRLTTDAQALAMVTQRWVTPAWNVFNINWQSDKLAITGTEPFFNTGSTVDWWRFSNEGDRWLGANPQSNSDGHSELIDVGLTFTPVERLAVKYRWLRMESKQNFLRGTYAMNGGVRPDGRIVTLAQALTTITLDEQDQSDSDAQQLDATYHFPLAGMRHTLTAGWEARRLVTRRGDAPTDSALFGTNSYRRRDPFAEPVPSLYALVRGPTPITSISVAKYRDAYVSHRGTALGGKLHTLAGFRYVKNLDLGRKNDTLTLGAVYEALPGVHLFASRSNTFIITNAFNITGPGVLPSDNQRRLKDETGNGWEAGFKSSLGRDRLTGTVSVFEVERANIVGNSSSNNATDPRNLDSLLNNDVRFSDNGGVQVSRGIDCDLAWTPSERFQTVVNFGHIWTARVLSDPSIDLRVRSRAYQRAFERRLTKTPRNSVSVLMKYSFASDGLRGLSCGGAVRYSDEYEVVNTPNFDVMVPAETIVDLFATYDRLKLRGVPTTLQVNIKNLTDRRNDITRANGREYSASVRLRF